MIPEILYNSDVSFDYRNGKNEVTIHQSNLENWKVTVVDTGYNTMTGGRIKRIQKYIGNEPFMLTYGDGVSNVDINELIKFHNEKGQIATMTAINIGQQFGCLDVNEDGSVLKFREKNEIDGNLINAGFMALEPQIFDYIEGDETVFEKTPIEQLAKDGQLNAFIHHGFWKCMDTVRDRNHLESLIENKKAPWIVWEE